MKKIIAYVLVCLMIMNVFGSVAFAEENRLGDAKDTLLQLVAFVRSFKDATEHWANKFIAKLYDAGFISGYPDGTFRPDNPIKRGEFTKIFITSVTDKDPGNSGEGHWAQQYVNAAINDGYLKPGEFSDLDKNITRAEIAMMTSRDLKEDPNNIDKLKNNITDFSSIENKYKDHVAKVYAAGIVTGYEDGTFRPEGEASRAEASTMIVRLLDESERRIPEFKEKKEETGYKDVSEIAEKELLTKYVPDEDNGMIGYRVGNEYEKVKYVYQISKSDLPIKIGEYILYDIENKFEEIGNYKLPCIIVHQTVENETFYDGLYMNIADKDFKVLRPRNNYSEWTPDLAPTPKIDGFGNKIYKTYYGIIVLDDLPDWKTYRGKDAYNLIFNDKKSDYAVIVENVFNK